MATRGRGTRGQNNQGQPIQDPRLFSLSTREEDLNQLNIITTCRGTKTAVPTTSGDPWCYYGPEGSTLTWRDSSTEVMDTDEGNCTSRTLIDTAQRMAAEARGDPMATYAEVADPILMFTALDAAIADLMPQPKGEYPNTADVKPQSTLDETFAPFDFEEAFISRHGITLEEADMPASKRRTESGTPQCGSSRASSVRTIPGDMVGHSESHPHGLATVLPHHCQPSSMEVVQTYGLCLHGQETIAGMGSYP